MHCSDNLQQLVDQRGSCVLLGLDPDETRIPCHISGDPLARVERFSRVLVESCAPQICGIKIQLACFERHGSGGMAVVEKLIVQAHSLGLMVVMDGKRGDIASTASAYAEAYLHPDSTLAGDALTVNPWLGADAIKPFVDAACKHNRLLFLLVHTSNPDASMFQAPAHNTLADLINQYNATDRGANGCGRVGAVVGATHGDTLAAWHTRLPASWLLSPGLGAQQGDVNRLASLAASGARVLVPVSRSIIYADNSTAFARSAARKAAEYRLALQSV